MSERLTFTLEGRDQLSRVLGHAGDSADRLRRQMEDAADGSGRAILTLTQDADGRLRDLEGRFVSTADAAALLGHRAGEAARPMADWSRVAEEASRAGEALRSSLISLAPAIIPMAASLAPIGAAAAGAGAGLGVFALAAGRQVAAMTEAAEAEKKYTDAVEQNGTRSQEAVKAQVAYAKQMALLPPATREAAAALSVFKGEYSDWADSLAGDTTAPLIKGMGVLQGIFPKLTPSVKGASEQLDRMLTLAGGGVASPGFDAFMKKFDTWTTGALTRATDGLVHLLRVSSEGGGGGGLAEFMDFARAQGPMVAATLKDLGSALLHVLEAGADVGVGMLAVVQVLSRLVGAVPPGAITLMFQLALSIKATALAMAGLGAARGFAAAFTTQIAMVGTASGTATTRMAGLTAGFGAMSRGAKAALIGSGIGLLVIALSELSANSAKAPPDVDKLTVSLKQLGATGPAVGEAAKSFGSDLGGLFDKVRAATDPSTTDQVQQWIVTLGGLGNWDSTPVKQGKENLDAIDQSLASLVSSGKPELAAAALSRLAAEYAKGGRDAGAFTGAMDGYQSALADAKFEADLVAQSMGLFGAQAMATKAKLDAQKMSADGLRQSIVALNDVNRAGISAQIAFEAALDTTAKAATDNANVWRANGGTLDLSTEKGRTAAAALNDLAAKTDAAAAAARDSGASWSTVNGIYERGRQQLAANAAQMGLNRAAVEQLTQRMLQTPDKTARLKGNIEDLQAKIAAAKSQLSRVPDARRAQVRANIAQLEGQLAAARQKLDALDGKTSVTYVKTVFSSDRIYSPPGHNGPGGFPKYASGTDSAASGWALVGEEGPELVRMRGGEQVFDHRTSMRMSASMADYPALSLGQQAGAGLAAGLLQSVNSVTSAARLMASGVEAGVRAELQIASPSKKMTALMGDVKAGIIKGLTGSRAQIRATVVDLVKDIWKAWEGQKTNKDSGLVRLVNREHEKLQKLAGKRDSVKGKLAGAQATLKARTEERDRYRADVRAGAQRSASLSGLGLDAEEVTAGTIRGGLQAKLAKLKQFHRTVMSLAKRGLSKGLLKQVVDMGPDEGLAYASALAGMTPGDFRQINSLQSQIDREADALGKNTSTALYGAGVDSARGLVKGLQSQQKEIEKQMLTIARGMERAIKKALGIKSPSRVGVAIGANFGASVGGGVVSALPTVGRAVDAVAGRMAGMRPAAGRPVSGASSVPQTVNHFHIQTIDPGSAAREVRKILLADKRVSGGVARGFE